MEVLAMKNFVTIPGFVELPTLDFSGCDPCTDQKWRSGLQGAVAHRTCKHPGCPVFRFCFQNWAGVHRFHRLLLNS